MDSRARFERFDYMVLRPCFTSFSPRIPLCVCITAEQLFPRGTRHTHSWLGEVLCFLSFRATTSKLALPSVIAKYNFYHVPLQSSLKR